MSNRRTILLISGAWKTAVVVCAVLAMAAPPAPAQTIGRVGTTAAPFLKIGIAARGVSMGDAFTATADDPSAMYWNPSGLAWITQGQALYSHNEYFADIAYDYAGLTLPTGIGTFGAFLGYMDYGEIERTTEIAPNGTGEMVSASSMVLGASYARNLTDRFAIGGNIKYIHETIWHCASSSYAIDLGVSYRMFFHNLKIGMSISNFGADLKMDGRDLKIQHDVYPDIAGNNPNIDSHLDTDEFPLPILFRLGIASNLTRDFFGMEDTDWTVAVDAIHPNDNQEYLNLGSEVRLFDRLVSFRGGFRQLLLEKREGGLTLGMGVELKIGDNMINVDYAYADYGRLGSLNKLTLMLAY